MNEETLAALRQYVANSMEKAVFQVEQQVDYNIYESPVRIDELEDFVDDGRKPTFQQVLFQLIDEKGASDASIYNKAWIDRRHFSKIRSNPNYRIGKNSVIALALALELSLTETGEFLNAAGFSLSDSNKADLVIQFCLENEIYNLHDVNEALHSLDLKPLASHG